MNDRTAGIAPPIHGDFTIERRYDAPLETVFAAWTDPDIKAKWFRGPEGWKLIERVVDVRPGGREVLHGRFDSGVETLFTACYHAVIPDRRLVYVYDMHISGAHLSVSLATVEFERAAAGTAMTFTEQAVYFDGADGTESRRGGTDAHFDRLARLF